MPGTFAFLLPFDELWNQKLPPVGRRIKGFRRFLFRDVAARRYPIPLSLCRRHRMLQYDPAVSGPRESSNRCVLIKSKTVPWRVETVRVWVSQNFNCAFFPWSYDTHWSQKQKKKQFYRKCVKYDNRTSPFLLLLSLNERNVCRRFLIQKHPSRLDL